MKTKYVFLTLGLIFSIFLLKFQMNNGFEFLNFQVQSSIIDVSLFGSREKYLYSTILGYLCYLIFGLTIWNKKNGKIKIVLSFFLLFTFIGIGFELKAIFENLNGIYNGKHFRIGVLLAFIGFLIAYQTKKKA